MDLGVITQFVDVVAQQIIGAIFIVAAVTKILARDEFIGIVYSYDLLPQRWASTFSLVLPWCELSVGIFLVLPLPNAFSLVAIASSGLMLCSFAVAQTLNLLRGRIIPCGCLGNSDRLISWQTVGWSVLGCFFTVGLIVSRLSGSTAGLSLAVQFSPRCCATACLLVLAGARQLRINEELLRDLVLAMRRRIPNDALRTT